MENSGLRIAILDDWHFVCPPLAIMDELRALGEVTVYHDHVEGDALVTRLQQYDIVIPLRERTSFDAQVLNRLSHLRLIAQTGSGAAHIDLTAASRVGIPIAVTPGGSNTATAELTLLLILAVARRLVSLHQGMSAGEWPAGVGEEVEGKQLGLIGFGRVGQAVATRAAALGMKVVAWSPTLTPERAARYGAAAVSLSQLLAESKYVSLHLKLAPETVGFISMDRLRQMRPDAALINTARGALVVDRDLIAALEQGIIRAAALDVFTNEPLPDEHPLRRLPNVILTPHIGWTTVETYSRFLTGCVENIRALLANKPQNILNPEALQRGEHGKGH